MAVFGIDTALIAAGVAAAGSIGGQMIAQSGSNARAQAANAMGFQMQIQDQLYEQQQAQMSRDFSADQAVKAQQFNDQEMGKAMAYNSAEAVLGRDFAATQQQSQQSYEAQQADIQRAWQAQMSGTAYQRSVADMKAAGLNPILGVASGGASTPSGAMPSTGIASASTPSVGAASIGIPGSTSARSSAYKPVMGQTFDLMSPAVSNALSAARLVQDIDTAKANISNTEADTANKALGAQKTIADTEQVHAATAALTKDLDVKDADIDRIKAATGAEASLPALNAAQAQAAVARALESTQGASTGKAQESLINEQRQVLERTGGSHTASEVSGAAQMLEQVAKGVGSDVMRLYDYLRH